MNEDARKLGISPDASKDEIKARFRELARIHHPDLGGNAEAFEDMRKAYERLIGAPCAICRGRGKVSHYSGLSFVEMQCPKCKGVR